MQNRRMAITRLNPEQLHHTAGYSHVTIVDSGRLAVLAGQCPLGRDTQLVGRGDILAQVDQVVVNAAEALAAAGTGAADVIRSVIYVVSDDPGVLSSVWDRLSPAQTTARLSPRPAPFSALAALGYRDQLVEVDLTAALPGFGTVPRTSDSRSAYGIVGRRRALAAAEFMLCLRAGRLAGRGLRPAFRREPRSP